MHAWIHMNAATIVNVDRSLSKATEYAVTFYNIDEDVQIVKQDASHCTIHCKGQFSPIGHLYRKWVK